MKRMPFRQRKGSVLVLVAVCMTLLFLALALTLDLGWIWFTEGKLQNAADAAALAAASQLIDDEKVQGAPDQSDEIVLARNFAQEYVAYHEAGNRSLTVDRNDANEISGGIVMGYLDNPLDHRTSLQTQGVGEFNSVQVSTRLSQEVNGPLGLFLGGITGVNEVALNRTAVATTDNRIIGFDAPPGEMIDMLPFTIYIDTWYEAIDGSMHDAKSTCPHEPGVDKYSFNKGTHTVGTGSDGTYEVKLYPNKEDICHYGIVPGNFGTLDIGSESNSTSDIMRQIVSGISSEDIASLGGLELNQTDGSGRKYKWFNGDTGVSNTVKSALEDIIGKPKIIPLYSEVLGTGDTAMYKIVEFAGVVVVDVRMTAALEQRGITVQPCSVLSPHAVFHPDAPPSQFVYGVALVR